MAEPLKSSLFGAYTFCARQHGADDCDSKGLPLTPNTTNIIGRSMALLAISHPHLAAYLDFKKTRNERILVVCEWFDDSLENHVHSNAFTSPLKLSHLAQQILSALSHLSEEFGITHRSLSPASVLLTPQGDVKLHNFGLYNVTDCGQTVDFVIGSPRYMAPEVLMDYPHSRSTTSAKADVWSLGIMLLELFLETPLYPELFLRNSLESLFKRIILLTQNYMKKSVNPLASLLEAHGCSNKEMNSDLNSFLEACLIPIPSKRPTASELLQHPFITQYTSIAEQPMNDYTFLPSPFTKLVRCTSIDLPTPDYRGVASGTKSHPHPDHLTERPMREVYYLWSLAGGDVQTEMQKQGVIRTCPSICSLPRLVLNDGQNHGLRKDKITLYDSSVVTLSLEQLTERLETMTTDDYYPLEEVESEAAGQKSLRHDSTKLPLAIRERDVDYQFHRVVIFSRLLEGYPFSHERILQEALIDVCPLYRGEIWATLLGVKGDIDLRYTNIDKDTETMTDRQIDVDIPRCHQYDILLSSSEGHRKFKRVLKSWVVSSHKLVYWQGLDSLCAPFLALNFNNEALTYTCLSAFIDKYLYKFFLKDNSPIMQEYLTVFSQLVAFHEPILYNHLDSIGFNPELYAIPWFLTMFTHILPLNKIYHLWDTMLLGNASFPLCVGVAILLQLKTELLLFDFNECILMFSDLPDIDIQQCVYDAVRIYQLTPPSASVRCHVNVSSQHFAIPSEIQRPPLPLSTLRAESCPQISAYDFIILCRLESHALNYNKPTFDPAHDNPLLLRGGVRAVKRSRQKAIVIDIRQQEEFRQGHVMHSINIPQHHAFQADGSLSPSNSSSSLDKIPRGRVLIVVGSKGDSTANFGRQLVRLDYPKVCVLYGGTGVLRTLGLLSSLDSDP